MSVFITLLFVFAAALSEAAPRIKPAEYYWNLGQAPEPLPVETLIDAAFRASGASQSEAAVASERLQLWIEKLKNETAEQSDERQRAEYVLTFMHGSFFKTYDEYQTRVDTVLKDGRFNCVSSAVLYLILSRSVGLEVVGVGTRDHAFCSVLLPDSRVDVETTIVYGFDPGTKKEFRDAFGNVTGYSYVPLPNYENRNELSERELIALIFQNRISMLEAQNKYEEALELAVDRYAMAPVESTRDHLSRGALNYAALLNERKKYSEAIDFLARFVHVYGWSESVRDIYGVLHYNRVVTLIKTGAFSEAVEIINELEVSGWVEPEVLQGLRSHVAERILAKRLPVLTSEEGFELLSGLRDAGFISPKKYIDSAVMLISTEAEAAAATGSYLTAAEIVDRAILMLGQDIRLETARLTYRYNFAVGAHNTFAELFNEGKYLAARTLLAEATKKVPESDVLRQDMMLLDRALSGRK